MALKKNLFLCQIIYFHSHWLLQITYFVAYLHKQTEVLPSCISIHCIFFWYIHWQMNLINFAMHKTYYSYIIIVLLFKTMKVKNLCQKIKCLRKSNKLSFHHLLFINEDNIEQLRKMIWVSSMTVYSYQ